MKINSAIVHSVKPGYGESKASYPNVSVKFKSLTGWNVSGNSGKCQKFAPYREV